MSLTWYGVTHHPEILLIGYLSLAVVQTQVAVWQLVSADFRWWLMPPQIEKFMGPTWGPPGSCRPQMGPMLAPWILLSGSIGGQIWRLTWPFQVDNSQLHCTHLQSIHACLFESGTRDVYFTIVIIFLKVSVPLGKIHLFIFCFQNAFIVLMYINFW